MDTAAVCKQCDHPAGSQESLERHSTRCANGGQRHYMHAGLVALIACNHTADVWCSQELLEKKGLRPGNMTRPPGDIVVLNFYGLGRHLIIDVVLSTVYRSVTLAQTCFIPGYAAKSPRWLRIGSSTTTRSLPIRCPCACLLCDGGWGHIGYLGAHALALLKQLAEQFAVSRGSFCTPDSRAPLTAPMQVSLWVQRWQHRLSTWLHAPLSQQLMRM